MQTSQLTKALIGGPRAAAQARGLVREVLGPHVTPRCLDDAVLVATELTNVALGGRAREQDHRRIRFVVDAGLAGTLRLWVELGPIDLRASVSDRKDALVLIDQLSSAWGVMDAPPPLIWAELQLQEG